MTMHRELMRAIDHPDPDALAVYFREDEPARSSSGEVGAIVRWLVSGLAIGLIGAGSYVAMRPGGQASRLDSPGQAVPAAQALDRP
jgi:hypothetical protein